MECGYQSRAAFIYFGGIPCADLVISCCDRLVFRTTFGIVEILCIMIEKQQNQARTSSLVTLFASK